MIFLLVLAGLLLSACQGADVEKAQAMVPFNIVLPTILPDSIKSRPSVVRVGSDYPKMDETIVMVNIQYREKNRGRYLLKISEYSAPDEGDWVNPHNELDINGF
jgi:hypothetical protein